MKKSNKKESDESLYLLVANTQNIQPEIVELEIRTRNYDIAVLIPSLTLPLDDRYIRIEGEDLGYSVYINRISTNNSFTPLKGCCVCGIALSNYNIDVLSVNAELGDDFVRNLTAVYPDKVLLVVNPSYPNIVFDICTKKIHPSIQKKHLSLHEIYIDKPPVLV